MAVTGGFLAYSAESKAVGPTSFEATSAIFKLFNLRLTAPLTALNANTLPMRKGTAEGEGRREGGESGGAAAEELARSGAAETGDGGSERAGEPDT